LNTFNEIHQQRRLIWLTLFTSTSTLVCCAIPIILVTLGMGAAVASLVSAFPFLIVLSQYKLWVFIFSGIMLFVSGWLIFKGNKSCPTDPKLAAICIRVKKWNRRIYWFSVSLWAIGFIAAFLVLPFQIWLDS